MKSLKRITSTLLSMTIISGIAAAGLPQKTTTFAANSKVMYQDVLSQWQTRINNEKAKYPNKSYWNHKGLSSYNDETHTNQPCYHVQDYAKGEKCCNQTIIETGEKQGQCYGFAYKLASDIWGTTEFYESYVDQNYEPRKGDNVRLEFSVQNKPGNSKQGHSIFITDISGENITFAECNGELQDCQIRWDRTRYYNNIIAEDVWVEDSNGDMVKKSLVKGDKNSLTTVTKSYLRAHATKYFRPIIAGDLNKNGVLDSDDSMIFQNTVMTNGRTLYDTKLSYYDVNGDGYVNTYDLNEIRYGTYNHRIVMPNENPSCRWRRSSHTSSFTFNDGCYYVKNDLGGVSWIGALDSELTTIYVPSKVYCPSDKCWYDVTEIGYNAYNINARAGWRTCTAGYRVNTLYIPDTVKRIHSFALEDWSITSLKFSGSNPQLETVDQYAFFNCKSLKTLDLSPAKKLKTIGNYAFNGCTSLYHIDLPYTGNAIDLGSGSESIFGSTDPSSATIEVKNPNTSTSPASNYQRINISDKDYNYWKNNKLYYYGKLFKLYKQNTYLGKVDTYMNYLRP